MQLILVLLFLTWNCANGEDWPQFLGPSRDGHYSGPELPAACAVTDPLGGGRGMLHESLLDIASGFPVLADVHYDCVAHFSILYTKVASESADST